MKKILQTVVWSLALGCILLPGCSVEKEPVNGKRPAISVASAHEGAWGDVLTINGSNFGNDPQAVSVFFGEVPGTIVSLTDNRIVVTVPNGEQWEKPEVMLRVEIDGRMSNGQPFLYLQKPEITNLSTDTGIAGEVIEIYGKRFAQAAADNKVMCGTVAATVLEATTTKLTIELPYNYTAKAPLTLTKYGRFSTGPVDFTFDLPRQDSLAIMKADWKTKSLREDILWKSAIFSVFDGPRSVNVIEIAPGGSTEIGFAATPSTTTSRQCSDIEALAGINGGFFGPGDYLRIDGSVIDQGRDEPWSYVNAAIVRDAAGFSIMTLTGTGQANTKARELNAAYTDVMVAGPRLLNASVIPNQQTSEMWVALHPRTGFGINAQTGTIYMVTVDGRFAGSAIGLSIKDFSYLMRILGCTDAINLDGGGSTTMYVKGEPFDGVVNYPCDNGKFDHEGERKVANILYVK